MSDKKVCEVCGREDCSRRAANYGSLKWGLCYQGGYERLSAILTPEVLRLIEAGRAVRRATYERHHGEPNDQRLFQAELDADTALTNAALALPFEKPAEQPQVTKEQLSEKGGET
jgi:hypothetical protein